MFDRCVAAVTGPGLTAVHVVWNIPCFILYFSIRTGGLGTRKDFTFSVCVCVWGGWCVRVCERVCVQSVCVCVCVCVCVQSVFVCVSVSLSVCVCVYTVCGGGWGW